MGTPADKMTLPANAASTHPATSIGDAAHKRHWLDHAARTTAVLAVLAAISSGQYANQFSRTILAQAEASDQWSYFQTKSIKRHIVSGQIALLKAMALTDPKAASQLEKLQKENIATVKKYEMEINETKTKTEA